MNKQLNRMKIKFKSQSNLKNYLKSHNSYRIKIMNIKMNMNNLLNKRRLNISRKFNKSIK